MQEYKKNLQKKKDKYLTNTKLRN